MKKESVFYGTLILIIINIAIKILSLLYRGILIRLIGPDGIGMMEMITPLFSFLLVIASWGVPMAISNKISTLKTKSEINDIFHCGFKFLCINSTLVCILFLLALPFCKQLIFSDIKVIPGFLPLLPTVIIISVFSAYRGYFQGTQRSSLLGYSQLTEQIVRIILGILIVHYLILKNADRYSILIGISLATLFAEISGGLLLFFKYKSENQKQIKQKTSFFNKELIKIGTPLTLSRLIITLSNAVQAVLIPYYLILSGYSTLEAAAFYGYFMGVAVTIIHLPGIVTGALSTPLLPAISSAHGNHFISLRNSRILKGMLYTAISATPLLALIFYFSEPLCRILFHSSEAASILRILCVGGYFLYLQQPLVSALQGMNKFRIIFTVYFIGYFSYLIALIYLGKIHLFSEQNIIFAYISCDLIIFIILYLYLTLKEKIRFQFLQWFFIPILGICGGFIVSEFLKNKIQTVFTEIIGITLSALIFLLIYFVIIFLCGIPDKETVTSFLQRRKHR